MKVKNYLLGVIISGRLVTPGLAGQPSPTPAVISGPFWRYGTPWGTSAFTDDRDLIRAGVDELCPMPR